MDISTNIVSHLTSFNTITVLVGTALLGFACGIIGSFTTLRDRALVGDCVAHASLPGICVAFLLLRDRSFLPLFCGAICSGLLSVWCISLIRSRSKIKSDSAIALTLSCFFGAGIALSRWIQNLPGGSAAGLDSFILGKAASISYSDLTIISCVALLTVSMTLILFKEFVLICFDRDFAAVQGYPVNLLEIFLMILMCLCVAAGLPAVGAVLVVALLIFPPVTARVWSSQIKTVVILSGALGALCCVCGVSLSAITPSDYISGGLPTGPIIVVCAALLLSASLIAKALIRLINKPTNQLAQKTQSGEPC